MERGAASAGSISSFWTEEGDLGCKSGTAKVQRGCSETQNVDAAFEMPAGLRGTAACHLNTAPPGRDKAEAVRMHPEVCA